jgi:hypothetical protein
VEDLISNNFSLTFPESLNGDFFQNISNYELLVLFSTIQHYVPHKAKQQVQQQQQ